MKKILYFGSMGLKRNRLDGVTMKSRCLYWYLKKQKIDLYGIDVDNYKKNFLSIIFNFLKYYFKCDKIIISASPKGSYYLLKTLYILKCKKDIYYFVAGGSLANYVKLGEYNLSVYHKIKKMYVQSKKMQKDLINLGLKNVEFLSNFRKVEKWENKYKKEPFIKFVFYGRVIKEKGVEQAINLINKLNHNGIFCKLDIYGQVAEEYLKELEKKFNKNVKYKGFIIPDGKVEYEILSKYDLMLFPTEWEGEGLPGSLIDSYFAGLGIVASNWEYAHEFIENNVNGIIFDYKDYEDMYNKTYYLIMNNKIDSFKKESVKLSKQYHIENVLKKFINEILK